MPRRVTLAVHAQVMTAAAAVALATGAPLDQILRGSRTGRRTERSLARQPKAMTAYLAVTQFNLPQATVARALGKTRQCIVRQVRRIEDARDDPAFDTFLAGLEQQLDRLLQQVTA